MVRLNGVAKAIPIAQGTLLEDSLYIVAIDRITEDMKDAKFIPLIQCQAEERVKRTSRLSFLEETIKGGLFDELDRLDQLGEALPRLCIKQK